MHVNYQYKGQNLVNKYLKLNVGELCTSVDKKM